MKFSFVSAGVIPVIFYCCVAASAQSQPITVYCTTISENDKSASDGFALTDAGSILRQDRANFHKFGYRDAGDESDRYFTSTGNRAKLPGLLAAGVTERSVLNKIVRGTPHVCVSVYKGWLDVTLD